MRLVPLILLCTVCVFGATSPNVKTNQQLLSAAGSGDVKLLSKLLSKSKGANVNYKDKHGVSALYRAAWGGHADAVVSLLDHGALVDEVNESGETPLVIAAFFGYPDVVKVLLDRKAVVDTEARDGETALSAAVARGQEKVVKLLLENGADPDKGNVLYSAALRGHTGISRMLIDNGADVNKLKKNGASPLLKAAINGHTEIAQMLLKHGANVDQAVTSCDTRWRYFGPSRTRKCSDLRTLGATPLYRAAKRGNLDMVKLLVNNGANVGKENSLGEVPLDIARENDKKEVIKFLMQVKQNKRDRPVVIKKKRKHVGGKITKGAKQKPDKKIILKGIKNSQLMKELPRSLFNKARKMNN